MRVLTIIAACLLAAPAWAVEFEAGIGPTIHERCHMGGCGFSTIIESHLIGSRPEGELYQITALSWSTEYKEGPDGVDYNSRPIRTTKKERNVFEVFCSKTRPVMFFQDGNKWQSTSLRPGDDQAVFGANESAYRLYWGSCHHFFPTDKDEKLEARMAVKLGYRLHGGFPDNNPDDNIQPDELRR